MYFKNLCQFCNLLIFCFINISSPLLFSLPLSFLALSFVRHLTPSLVRICGVRCLLGEAEALRAQPYSQEDEEHERMLLEVGDHLPPSCGDRHAVSIGEDYISVTLSTHCLVPFSSGLSWCQTFIWNPESPSSGRTLVSKATTLLQTSGGWECLG